MSARHGRIGACIVIALAFVASAACSGASGSGMGVETLAGELPAGESAPWYWDRIESLGFEVTSVNYEQDDYVEYEVVRDDETYEVKLDLEPDSRVAQGVEVTGNFWKSEETAAALERNRETVALPWDTVIRARLEDHLDSGESHVGQSFTMSVTEPVAQADRVVVPAGTVIRGEVASVQSAGRPQSGGRLVLRPVALVMGGEEIPIDATLTGVPVQGRGSHEEDLKEIGIGAGVGAVIGGLLEGGKGAVGGAIAGAGGTFLATKGEQIELPPGTPVVIELDQEVRVPARR